MIHLLIYIRRRSESILNLGEYLTSTNIQEGFIEEEFIEEELSQEEFTH